MELHYSIIVLSFSTITGTTFHASWCQLPPRDVNGHIPDAILVTNPTAPYLTFPFHQDLISIPSIDNSQNKRTILAISMLYDLILQIQLYKCLTHWGPVTHICVGKLTILGSNNGLSPGRSEAIIWTNAGILLIGPLGTNFSEILSEI